MIDLEARCADLQRRLDEAQAAVGYYREIAREAGQKCLRETDQLANLVAGCRLAEQALRESEKRLRSIFDSARDGLFVIDRQGRIVDVNPEGCRMLGIDSSELRGIEIQTLIPLPYSGACFKEDRMWQTGGFFTELPMRRIDGRLIYVETTVAPFTLKGQEFLLCVKRDITARRRAEAEKAQLETRYQEVQRMEAIGTLAGGIAHDFNNLLMGIQGNISLMRLAVAETDALYNKLESIEQCVKSASQLTRQLLGYAQGGKYVAIAIDVHVLLEKTVSMFVRTRKDITVLKDFKEGLPLVKADFNQLEQVLLNLYVNAGQAMPSGGQLTLATDIVSMDETLARSHDIAAGAYVRIAVKDSGTGMDSATRRRVFEPFFTTREMGRGTGLGLAAAFGIVKNHGGTIDCQSQPGKGSRFCVYLPVAKPAGLQPSAAAEPICGGSEVVLLVDDETLIIDVGTPMLKALGYEVLTACGGKEAVALFEAQRHVIDLVILDMIMPEISGGEVFDRIRAIAPSVKVLLSSGYSLDGQAQQILQRGCDGFIQKPFDLNSLSRKVREVLDGSASGQVN
jgi:two-component system cell cycle sensor histidine kinase/response regulator CckA